jgi:hypothetical protein
MSKSKHPLIRAVAKELADQLYYATEGKRKTKAAIDKHGMADLTGKFNLTHLAQGVITRIEYECGLKLVDWEKLGNE